MIGTIASLLHILIESTVVIVNTFAVLFTKMNLYIITKYITHYLDTEFNGRILSLWSMSAALISPTADILITQRATSFSTRDIRMLAMD